MGAVLFFTYFFYGNGNGNGRGRARVYRVIKASFVASQKRLSSLSIFI